MKTDVRHITRVWTRDPGRSIPTVTPSLCLDHHHPSSGITIKAGSTVDFQAIIYNGNVPLVLRMVMWELLLGIPTTPRMRDRCLHLSSRTYHDNPGNNPEFSGDISIIHRRYRIRRIGGKDPDRSCRECHRLR
ncbi:MAG: hypothetical protein MZV63_57675 [Marinilabiliales bacterium]|nr:hypothetical protein [Marinilabiliales bacterium]